MFVGFKIILLVALIRVLVITDKPLLCSGIYSALALVFGLLSGHSILAVVITAVIGFGLASLYFWALSRLEDSQGLWWLVAIGGILIGVV